jgi:uncharacterized protein (TIGR02453 family)
MPRFPGFSKDALAFFKAVHFHQNREWFSENRALYENEVKAPMLALLEDLSARFADEEIPLRGDAKSMFRINRDIRFSKDKRPYQTHTSAVMTRSGGKNDHGLLYIHVTADGLASWDDAPEGSFMAAGFYQPDADRLNAIRNAIRRKPKAFQEMEAKLKKARLRLSTESQLTRVPRGFEDMKEGAVEGAIRLKNFIVEEPIAEAVVTSGRLPDTLVKFIRRALPLLEFGWKAIGKD